MNRRDIMLGLLTFGMAQLGRAQQPAKAVRIAFIRTGKPPETFVSAFKKGMRDLGYVEGENFSIEYRIEEASPERLSAIVEEVVRSKVDVIIASGRPRPWRPRSSRLQCPWSS